MFYSDVRRATYEFSAYKKRNKFSLENCITYKNAFTRILSRSITRVLRAKKKKKKNFKDDNRGFTFISIFNAPVEHIIHTHTHACVRSFNLTCTLTNNEFVYYNFVGTVYNSSVRLFLFLLEPLTSPLCYKLSIEKPKYLNIPASITPQTRVITPRCKHRQ